MCFKYVFIPSIHTHVHICIENEALVDLSLSKGLDSTHEQVAYVVSTAPLDLGFLCTGRGPESQCCLAGSVSAASLGQDAAGLCKLGRGDVEEGGTWNQSQQRQVLLQPVQAGDGDNAVGVQQPVTEEDDQTLLLGDQTLKRLSESRTCHWQRYPLLSATLLFYQAPPRERGQPRLPFKHPQLCLNMLLLGKCLASGRSCHLDEYCDTSNTTKCSRCLYLYFRGRHVNSQRDQ